jgi:hypothetical protein
VERSEQSDGERINGSGRSATQQREGPQIGFEPEDEDVIFEPDENWFDEGNPEAMPS